jgi:integrase
MGYVFQRGTVWWFQFYQDGQRVRMSSESSDKREAERQLAEHEARVTLKEPLVVRSARVSYDELRRDLVQHYQSTASRDLDEAGWRLRHLDRAFRGVRASRITGAAITAYIVQRQGQEIVSPTGALRRRPANGSINREVAVLLRMLRLGMEHGKVARMPIVHKAKEAPPRSGFFERGAFEAVRAQLPPDLQVAVTIAYTFGWRMQSEVLTLERSQLDLAAGTLRLEPGASKNEDARVVYLTPELRALLGEQLARVGALERRLGRVVASLFPHLAPGQRVGKRAGQRRDDFRKAWRTACTRAGYAGMLRHDFRRTAVRNMVNRSIPERVAMTITGHKTRSVFDRYHIVTPADLQAAARKLAEPVSATNAATVAPMRPLRPKRKAGESAG